MSVRPVAAALLAVEAAGIAALLVWQGLALAAGDTDSIASSVALMVLTLLGVVAVAGFAVATARERSWGRSGGIVVQALILAVAIGALTGEGANPLFSLALGVPAIVTAILLLLAVREAAPSRGED